MCLRGVRPIHARPNFSEPRQILSWFPTSLNQTGRKPSLRFAVALIASRKQWKKLIFSAQDIENLRPKAGRESAKEGRCFERAYKRPLHRKATLMNSYVLSLYICRVHNFTWASFMPQTNELGNVASRLHPEPAKLLSAPSPLRLRLSQMVKHGGARRKLVQTPPGAFSGRFICSFGRGSYVPSFWLHM